MAVPLTADRLLTVLRAEGVRVVEVGDWRRHNRNHMGPWGPVNGAMVHHTVTKGTATTVRICRDGYPGLPGPLCHGVIAKSGEVHLLSTGRASHAGGGDGRVLDRVIAEDYGTLPPSPTKGNSDGVDGNARFYGWECENLGDGRDPWPAAQVESIVRANAAICRAHVWSAKSVIGHAEWSDDKIDPRGVSMPTVRDRIAERLKHPASWSPSTVKPPPVKPPVVPVVPPKEAAVALANADIDKIARAVTAAVWKARFASPTAKEGEGDPTRQASTYLAWQDQHFAELMARLNHLEAAIESLTTKEN